MNKLLTGMLLAALFVVAGCYKDKGNYDYLVPEEPVVTQLDTVYAAFVGDSLIIKPVITAKGKMDLSYEWKIAVPIELREIKFTGPELHTVFGLTAERYYAQFTVTDNSNGMKYFHKFIIQGQTAFYKGITVLSKEGDNAELSFIKEDGTVQPRIYEALHDGEKLPAGPRQLIPIVHQYIAPSDVTSYWIFGSQGIDPGVQIDANNFKRIKYIRGNFFDPPASVTAGSFECGANGILQGVANGKLYVGTSQTWNLQPVYGMFGVPATGDYMLYRQAIFNGIMPYFLGYEANRKQVVAFTNFGAAAYIGTGYQVESTTAFDPVNVGLDMWNFVQVNNNNCFAVGKGPDGGIYELKFGVAFMGFIKISPLYKRPFIKPELISANTKWAVTPAEIFYFNAGSTIYRYNPLNEEVKPLITDFGGKTVTMVKLLPDGNTLVAGVEGSLYYLDISTGKFGDIIKKIDGIPGAPIDVTQRHM
jgi:hypothetical protein